MGSPPDLRNVILNYCYLKIVLKSISAVSAAPSDRHVSMYMIGARTSQIAKSMGPTWCPPGSCRPQMGPMLVPWTLLSGIHRRSDTKFRFRMGTRSNILHIIFSLYDIGILDIWHWTLLRDCFLLPADGCNLNLAIVTWNKGPWNRAAINLLVPGQYLWNFR